MRIVVIGCGWLGLPLAAELVAAGHDVHGTATREARLPEIAAVGATPHRLVVGAGSLGDASLLDRADRVVVAVPPSGLAGDPGGRPDGGGPDGDPAAAADALARAAAERGARHLLLCSSTGVYAGGPEHPWVGEDDVGEAPSPRAARLLAIEAAVRDGPVPATIARLGGLWGHGRHPVRSLAGRELGGPDVPVNLLHRHDAVRALVALIAPRATPGTFSVVADVHPPRGAFYRAEARRLGLPEPRFRDVPADGKRVSGEALADAVGVRPRWRPGDPEAP